MELFYFSSSSLITICLGSRAAMLSQCGDCPSILQLLMVEWNVPLGILRRRAYFRRSAKRGEIEGNGP